MYAIVVWAFFKSVVRLGFFANKPRVNGATDLKTANQKLGAVSGPNG